MKKYIGILAIIVFVMACESSSETYGEFTKEGEIIYIGKPDTIIVAHGFEKLAFSVVINSDPKIKSGVLRTKTEYIMREFDIIRTNNGQDTIKVDVDLDQGQYTFDIFLKDDMGHESLKVEVPVSVFGDNYTNSLIPRR